MPIFSRHKGCKHTFSEDKLTFGFVFPSEGYEQSEPEMDIGNQVKLANVKDPWIYLNHISRHIRKNVHES